MTDYTELTTGLRLDLHAVCDLVEQLSERGDITDMPTDVWEEIAFGWLGTLTEDAIEFLDQFNCRHPGSAFESVSIRPVRSDGEWDNFVELRFSPKFDEVWRAPGPVSQDLLEPVSESCYPEGLTFTIGVSRSGRSDSGGQRHAYSYTAIDLGGLEAHDRFIAFAKFHEDIIHSAYCDIDVECQHSIGVDDVKFNDSDAVEYLKQYASSRELATYSSDTADADIGFTLRHVVEAGQAQEATEGAVRMMVFFDILAQYFYGRRDRQTYYFGGEV